MHLAERGAFDRGDQLAFEAVSEEAVKFVEVGAGVDGDAEDASLEAVEAGVFVEFRGDEFAPDGDDAFELAVGFLDFALKLLDERRQRDILVPAPAMLLQIVEALLVGGVDGHHSILSRQRAAAGRPSTIRSMNLILIGYRGSGKTTLGKMLAQQLWKDFVDVDHEICQRIGNPSIAAIWEEHGESYFREVEVEVTADLCGRDNLVIALGGGTLMQAGARKAVEAAEAVRVYLKCEPTELHRRIQGDATTNDHRPNLSTLGGGLEEIEAMLSERQPTYLEVADHVLDVTRLSTEDAARYLIERCL